MRTDAVEILSDVPNLAVIRLPYRNFPGVLIQGKDLLSLCSAVEIVCMSVDAEGRYLHSQAALEKLSHLRTSLMEYLDHYGKVLAKHGNREPLRWSRMIRRERSKLQKSRTAT